MTPTYIMPLCDTCSVRGCVSPRGKEQKKNTLTVGRPCDEIMNDLVDLAHRDLSVSVWNVVENATAQMTIDTSRARKPTRIRGGQPDIPI